jgi:hypothetical protein
MLLGYGLRAELETAEADTLAAEPVILPATASAYGHGWHKMTALDCRTNLLSLEGIASRSVRLRDSEHVNRRT